MSRSALCLSSHFESLWLQVWCECLKCCGILLLAQFVTNRITQSLFTIKSKLHVLLHYSNEKHVCVQSAIKKSKPSKLIAVELQKSWPAASGNPEIQREMLWLHWYGSLVSEQIMLLLTSNWVARASIYHIKTWYIQYCHNIIIS